MSHLEEGQVVSIIPVGDTGIITPKRLELDEARREIGKILKASGLTAEDLLYFRYLTPMHNRAGGKGE